MVFSINQKPVVKWESPNGTIYQSDAIDLLRSLPDESIDLCITDPAYQSLERWRATGTTTRLKHSRSSSNDWFAIFPNHLYQTFFEELFRVMKPGTFFYMFCDEETRDIVCCGHSPQSGASIQPVGRVSYGGEVWSPICHAGFKYWKSLIWFKTGGRGMGYHFAAAHEFIIMAEKVERKGKHRKLNTNRPDVLVAKRLKGNEYYSTEKPEELFWALIMESSNEGDMCLDPFMGGGTLPLMAAKTGRKFIAGDVSDKAIEYSLNRLREIFRPLVE